MAGKQTLAKRLRIYGRVQGVSYRMWAQSAARKRNIIGWVRNRSDGTVELLARGKEDALEALISECYEGPESAEVESIYIEDAPQEEFEGFRIRDTL